MSKYCPIIQGYTVYLNCQECDSHVCDVEEDDFFYLLIAGTRTYDDYNEFKAVCDHMISNIKAPVIIVSGGASGADTMAERYAAEKGFLKRIFQADWSSYGKKAGYIRNKKMHDYISKYTNRGCLLFWDGSSKGTKQSFSLAKERNTQWVAWNYKEKKYIKH
nr:DUF2493 domain-containing protein [uncultured Butyrivibrio sp.]